MKKVVFIWIVFVSTLYAADSFLLPDQYNDALYRLKQKILSANKSLVILSAFPIDNALRYAIKKRLSHHVSFELITSSQTEAASFAVYQNTHIHLLRSPNMQQMHMTLLLLDDKEACFSSVALNTTAMRHEIGILQCGTTIDFYQQAIAKLRRRCDPYFITAGE